MSIIISLLINYSLYIFYALFMVVCAIGLYKTTKSFIIVFCLIFVGLIFPSWNLLYGYGMYWLEEKSWPTQKIFTSTYGVTDNIKCELRKKYFLDNNATTSQLNEITSDLYKHFIENNNEVSNHTVNEDRLSSSKDQFFNLYISNKNQIYTEPNKGIYCSYYDREEKKSETVSNKTERKNIRYIVICSTQEKGILIKKSKEIIDFKYNKSLGIERKLALKDITLLPFFNTGKGTYWGYTKETIFPNNLEEMVFK